MSEYYEAHASSDTVRVYFGSECVSRLPDLGVVVKPPGAMPTIISRAQAYYWTHAWQEDEGESLSDLGEGETRTFADGTSAVRWLLSSDDA